MKTAASTDYPILIVDDEVEVLESFELILNSGGLSNITTCRDSRKVLPYLEEAGGSEVILLDLIMPHLKGLDLLKQLSEMYPETPVIVVTATDEIDTAVDCMKAGAFDYLVKPIEKMKLISSVKRAIELTGANREVKALKKRVLSNELEHPESFNFIVTRNKTMLGIFRYIEAIGVSSEPVLITGETGVGKELIARAVHLLSGINGPFIGVNIAGLDDQNFSRCFIRPSEGAFTGADKKRDGLIKQAAGGTLFLDEIGDLSRASQIKLLRLLQEGEYLTLGSDLPQKSKARILAASNKSLGSRDETSPFRKDLYYRLQTHQIEVPPLRERLEDLPLLVDHFIGKCAEKLGRKPPAYPRELISLLNCHHFPGNIRELEAMIFDAVSKNKTGFLSLDSFKTRVFTDKETDFSNTCMEGGETIFSAMQTLPTLEESNWQLIREALNRSDGNQSIASRFLGISQPALSRRLKYNKNKIS